MSERLKLEDVRSARERIRPHLSPTPLRPSLAAPGIDLRLKLECWQPTGSFKVRGALSLMTALGEADRARGVAAASAGNHALGVAFAARCLGGAIPTTVFVPTSAPEAKVAKLRRFPVDVRQEGETYDDTVESAETFLRETGATSVHAFEDSHVAAGQGTSGLEIAEECPDVGTLLVPVGGGGLIAGVAVAAKALVPGVRIVAVQPDASPALRESLKLGRPLLTYPARPTLADGVAGGIGVIAFDHRDLIDDVVVVTEEEIEDAVVALLSEDQVVAEASGALGLAALRSGRVRPPGGRPVVAVVTGGNIDARVLARASSRPAREGRAARRPAVRPVGGGLAVAIGLALGALIAGVPGAGGGLLAGALLGMGLHRVLDRRTARRRAALAAPFPEDWRQLLLEAYDHYERLPDDWRRRFERDLRLFLVEKRITGVGAEATDELRLLVAASAVTLSLGWPDYEWKQLTEVLLYADDFDRDYTVGESDIAGQAHGWGTVILSVPSLYQSFEYPDDGHHVGIHEFAHILDVDHTHFDGIPVGLGGALARQWVEAAEREMAHLRRRRRSAFDDYGAHDPVEFLGVAVEAFFEIPQEVRRRHAEIYAILSAYFGQDPAAWDDARGLRE